MKKIFLLIAALLTLVNYTRAQLSYTLLQRLDSTYTDVKEFSPAYIAVLSSRSSTTFLDLRTNTGNSFGTPVARVEIGDTNSYFERLEPAGNYIYACGYNLQAINMTNPAAPVKGTIRYFGYLKSAGHYSSMLYLMTATFFNNVVKAYSLADPLNPVLVDSLLLPHEGDFRIWQDKLFYAQSDTGTGNRILTYNLSNTAPYFTAAGTLPLTTRSPLDIPVLDVHNNHLYLKTQDTLYDLRINTGGALQLARRLPVPATGAVELAAIDSSVICYRGYQNIVAQLLSSGATTIIDTTDRLTFNSFRDMKRLGSNIYFSSLMETKLVRLRQWAASIAALTGQDERFHVFPNPARESLQVMGTVEGTFRLYSADGRLMATRHLAPGRQVSIATGHFAAGHYYYHILAKDGEASSGKLLKE